MKFMEKLFYPKMTSNEGDLKSYLSKLKNGDFDGRLVYGVSNVEEGFLSYDPIIQPGALYCGSMGSGKSLAMRFTVGTSIFSSSEDTVYIMVDPMKGMTDYQELFQDKYKPNVVTALNSVDKFIPVIDMVYEECMARKDLFTEKGANSIKTYNEKFGQNSKLAKIIICIEEFHKIPSSNMIKFYMKSDVEGSIANKMKELFRIGRSYGISFMLATQRAVSEDVPSSIKPVLSMMMSFKMTNPGDAAALNLPHADEIKAGDRGLAAYEDGFLKYPWLKDNTFQWLLDKYYKPLTAKLLVHTVEDYHTALGQEGNSGMVKIKPLVELIKFNDQFKFKDIANRFFEEFKFEVETQDNLAYVADLICKKNGIRYAVKLIATSDDGSAKDLANLKKGAESLNCDNIIVMSLGQRISSSVTNEAKKDNKIMTIDKEDFMHMARVLQNRAELEAKDSFNEFYLKLPLAKPQDLGLEENFAESEDIKEKDLDNLKDIREALMDDLIKL